MSGLFGKRLIIGSRSAINTALPRIRAATAIEIEDVGEIPVPFNINTRTNATICKATKKKIVGGSSSKNSFLSVVDSLVMELNSDESCRFHGSCSRIWLGRMRRGFHYRRDQRIGQKGGRPLRAARPESFLITGRCLCSPPPPLASFSPSPLSRH